MPLIQSKDGEKTCFRWGQNGTTYCGMTKRGIELAKQKAERQGKSDRGIQKQDQEEVLQP